MAASRQTCKGERSLPWRGRHELGPDKVRGSEIIIEGQAGDDAEPLRAGGAAARRLGRSRRGNKAELLPKVDSYIWAARGAAIAFASWATFPTGPLASLFSGWPRPISRASRWSTA